MKGLQWVKLPQNKIQGTIFEAFSLGKTDSNCILPGIEYKGLKVDYAGLEGLFSAKVIEKKEPKGTLKIEITKCK
jgi:hypothetical protein